MVSTCQAGRAVLATGYAAYAPRVGADPGNGGSRDFVRYRCGVHDHDELRGPPDQHGTASRPGRSESRADRTDDRRRIESGVHRNGGGERRCRGAR